MNFKKRQDDTAGLFRAGGVLPLDKNVKLSSAKLIWRAKNGLLPTTLNSLFIARPQNNSFHIPFRRLDMTQRCSTYQGVRDWNQIPEKIQSSKSLNILKTHYKSFLISQI